MYMVFRRLLVCLLWLWMPVSQAADSGWLRAADNQLTPACLRAQTEGQWRHSPAFRRSAGKGLENLLALAGKAASRRLSPGTRRWR